MTHFRDLVQSMTALLILAVALLIASCGSGEGSLCPVATSPVLKDCGSGTGNSGTAVSAGGASSAAIAAIRVAPATVEIAVGQSLTLTAQALDGSGNLLSGKVFDWATGNSAIATVTALRPDTVKVTAVAQGVVKIFATAESKEEWATVTVRAPLQISGRVVDGLSLQPLAGAQVTSTMGSVATTGSDGGFSMTVPGDGSGPAFLRFTASLTGYKSTELIADLTPPSTVLETILLVKATGLPSSITGAVRNAHLPNTSNNNGIANARVSLYEGQGAAGNLVAERRTDSNGAFSFTGLEAGVYTLWATHVDFSTCRRTAISLSSNDSAVQDLNCSKLDNTTRIVLTWGTSPRDLDAHLTGPTAGSANRFHVYYPSSSRGSLDASPFALLDVDVRQSLGPETITIKTLAPGVYRYSVHDFTNRNSATSAALGNSRAKVELFRPGRYEPEVFFVPNQLGNLWTVFELVGSANGDITVTPRNEMGLVADEATIQ